MDLRRYFIINTKYKLALSVQSGITVQLIFELRIKFGAILWYRIHGKSDIEAKQKVAVILFKNSCKIVNNLNK